MSKIQEIRNEIFDINREIVRLGERKRGLLQQLRATAKLEFEQRHGGLKKGDVMVTKAGDRYQYERVDFVDDTTLRVYVRKLKADGQPCKYEVWFHPNELTKADE